MPVSPYIGSKQRSSHLLKLIFSSAEEFTIEFKLIGAQLFEIATACPGLEILTTDDILVQKTVRANLYLE
jgi:hypothetical protein